MELTDCKAGCLCPQGRTISELFRKSVILGGRLPDRRLEWPAPPRQGPPDRGGHAARRGAAVRNNVSARLSARAASSAAMKKTPRFSAESFQHKYQVISLLPSIQVRTEFLE